MIRDDPTIPNDWRAFVNRVNAKTIKHESDEPTTLAEIRQRVAALVSSGKLTPEQAEKLLKVGTWFTSIADMHGGACTARNCQDAAAFLRREAIRERALLRIVKVQQAIESDTATDDAGLIAAFSEDVNGVR